MSLFANEYKTILDYVPISYNPILHNKQLENWFKQWGFDPKIIDYLPTTGFVIDDVCAAFLYKTNSKVCYIDGFISNKKAKKTIKEYCLNRVIESCLQLAVKEGFTKVMAQTKLETVINRASKFGFDSGILYHIMMKDL